MSLGNWSRFILSIALLLAASRCHKPEENGSGTPGPVNAGPTIDRIREDQARRKAAVDRAVDQSVAQQRTEAAKRPVVLSTGDPDRKGSLDGGPAREAANASIAGKLQGVAPQEVMVRDDSGFEYWLRTDEKTRVTQNGQPVRLGDFKQGTEVRASYVQRGKQRIATDVEVVPAE